MCILCSNEKTKTEQLVESLGSQASSLAKLADRIDEMESVDEAIARNLHDGTMLVLRALNRARDLRAREIEASIPVAVLHAI